MHEFEPKNSEVYTTPAKTSAQKVGTFWENEAGPTFLMMPPIEPRHRVYISGAITGLPEAEYRKAFNDAQCLLELIGFEVVNPLKLNHKANATWEDYMVTDIQALFTCDEVYMLTNWRGSRGARIEHAIAIEMGKRIFYQF